MAKQDILKKNLATFGQKPNKTIEPKSQKEVAAEPVSTSAPKQKRPVGRPKVYYGGIERTSITLEPEMMGKLRMLCLEQRRQIRDVIEEALQEYLIKFESEHGSIRVPATYRDK